MNNDLGIVVLSVPVELLRDLDVTPPKNDALVCFTLLLQNPKLLITVLFIIHYKLPGFKFMLTHVLDSEKDMVKQQHLLRRFVVFKSWWKAERQVGHVQREWGGLVASLYNNLFSG